MELFKAEEHKHWKHALRISAGIKTQGYSRYSGQYLLQAKA